MNSPSATWVYWRWTGSTAADMGHLMAMNAIPAALAPGVCRPLYEHLPNRRSPS